MLQFISGYPYAWTLRLSYSATAPISWANHHQ